VSGVTPRFPRTSSLTRCTDTPMCEASATWVIPRETRIPLGESHRDGSACDASESSLPLGFSGSRPDSLRERRSPANGTRYAIDR